MPPRSFGTDEHSGTTKCCVRTFAARRMALRFTKVLRYVRCAVIWRASFLIRRSCFRALTPYLRYTNRSLVPRQYLGLKNDIPPTDAIGKRAGLEAGEEQRTTKRNKNCAVEISLPSQKRERHRRTRPRCVATAGTPATRPLQTSFVLTGRVHPKTNKKNHRVHMYMLVRRRHVRRPNAACRAVP